MSVAKIHEYLIVTSVVIGFSLLVFLFGFTFKYFQEGNVGSEKDKTQIKYVLSTVKNRYKNQFHHFDKNLNEKVTIGEEYRSQWRIWEDSKNNYCIRYGNFEYLSRFKRSIGSGIQALTFLWTITIFQYNPFVENEGVFYTFILDDLGDIKILNVKDRTNSNLCVKEPQQPVFVILDKNRKFIEIRNINYFST